MTTDAQKSGPDQPSLRCPLCGLSARDCQWLRDVIEQRRIGWHDRPIALRLGPANGKGMGECVVQRDQAGRLRPRLILSGDIEGEELLARLRASQINAAAQEQAAQTEVEA